MTFICSRQPRLKIHIRIIHISIADLAVEIVAWQQRKSDGRMQGGHSEVKAKAVFQRVQRTVDDRHR